MSLLRLTTALTCFTLAAASTHAQNLTTVRIASGISNPTSLTTAPGDTERLFVTSGPKGIYIIKNGQLQPSLFLDLQGQLQAQGLGSMAFHPDYQNNGKFYVVVLQPGLMCSLIEYTVSATDPDESDPNSAVTILGPVQQDVNTHVWDHVIFGEDGMLYMSTGDGSFGDPVQNHSQDLGTLRGKILRLDVDAPAPYIPADNPFVGMPGARGEVWAYGLRNPWRFDFDNQTQTAYIADVGAGTREELNIVTLAELRGANFGWRCKEGTVCNNFAGCAPCGAANWIEPEHEYDHSELRCAIIGGKVYRGSGLPSLDGVYFFADHCNGIWSLRWDGNQVTEFTDRLAELQPAAGGALEWPNAFGPDAGDNLYILDYIGGEVFRIDRECEPAQTICSAVPNSASPGAVLSTRGTLNIASNDFALLAGGCPANKLGIFFYGFGSDNLPFGNGIRCVASPIFRLPAVMTDAFGRASYAIDFTAPTNQFQAGVPTYYQFWFRDPAAGGATYNSSSAIEAVFCP